MRCQTVKKPSADAAPGAGGTALSRSKFGRVSVLQKLAMKQRKKRRPGRPATGHDPIIPVRLPAKLVKDIDAWADVYRSERELEGMTRSTAIRCLILLGLERASYRAVDPKDQTSFEGATAPLLKFYRRAKVTRWLYRQESETTPSIAGRQARETCTAHTATDPGSGTSRRRSCSCAIEGTEAVS